MKNLFKKLLACCLAVCMVLTLCVGAITVGAEAAGYLTVGTVDITTDDKAAEVPVTIFSTAGIAAAEINVRVPENLSIAKLELVTEDTNVEVTFASAADPSGAPELLDSKATTSDVAPNVIDGVFTYIVHLPAGKVATTQVNVLITFAGAFAEGKIPVTADVEACKDATSDLLTLAITDGAINVAAAHVCAPAETVEENRVEATCYAEGSYDEVVKCSCGKEISRTPKTIEKIAHTPAEAVVENNKAATCYAEGSYDSVIYCAVEACKAEISRTPVTVDKTEHTPATAVEENRVEAKPGVAGSYDSVVYCSVADCKAEISRTPMEIPALPVEPEDELEDDRITFSTLSVKVGETIGLNIRVNKASSVNLFNKNYIVKVAVTTTGFDGTTFMQKDPTTKYATLTKTSSSRFELEYTGIGMYEFTCPIDCVIEIYDVEGGTLIARSPKNTITVAEKLAATLTQVENAIPTTTDETQKANYINQATMLSDLLNMGAAAQELFASENYFPDSDLANTQKFPLANAGLDLPYASEELDLSELNTENNLVVESAYKKTNTKNQTSCSIKLNPGPNFRYRYLNGINASSNLSMYVTYSNSIKTESDPSYPTEYNITDAIKATSSDLQAYFSNIAFYDAGQTVTVKLYEGENLVLTHTYSMESYIYDKISDTVSPQALKDFCSAFGKFGKSANVFF